MTRSLRSEERALWARVAATVRPLSHTSQNIEPGETSLVAVPTPQRLAPADQRRSPPPTRPRQPGGGLDSSWERRLARGSIQPDMTIDLHGHSLAGAHAFLARRLDDALATDARLVLLVTGKPPQGEQGPAGRGAIRAAIEDWIHASRHASDIAAVRPAHRRHGGPGALYLILRSRAARCRQKS
jgi:DNA-nicking Smr family endonuclease